MQDAVRLHIQSCTADRVYKDLQTLSVPVDGPIIELDLSGYENVPIAFIITVKQPRPLYGKKLHYILPDGHNDSILISHNEKDVDLQITLLNKSSEFDDLAAD